MFAPVMLVMDTELEKVPLPILVSVAVPVVTKLEPDRAPVPFTVSVVFVVAAWAAQRQNARVKVKIRDDRLIWSPTQSFGGPCPSAGRRRPEAKTRLTF